MSLEVRAAGLAPWRPACPLAVSYNVTKSKSGRAQSNCQGPRSKVSPARICAILEMFFANIISEVDVGVECALMEFFSDGKVKFEKGEQPVWENQQSAEQASYNIHIDMLGTRRSICDSVLGMIDEILSQAKSTDREDSASFIQDFVDRWRDHMSEYQDSMLAALRVDFDVVSSRSWTPPAIEASKKPFMVPSLVKGVLDDYVPTLMIQVTLGIQDALYDLLLNIQYEAPRVEAPRVEVDKCDTKVSTERTRAAVHDAMIHKLYRVIDDHRTACDE